MKLGTTCRASPEAPEVPNVTEIPSTPVVVEACPELVIASWSTVLAADAVICTCEPAGCVITTSPVPAGLKLMLPPLAVCSVIAVLPLPPLIVVVLAAALFEPIAITAVLDTPVVPLPMPIVVLLAPDALPIAIWCAAAEFPIAIPFAPVPASMLTVLVELPLEPMLTLKVLAVPICTAPLVAAVVPVPPCNTKLPPVAPVPPVSLLPRNVRLEPAIEGVVESPGAIVSAADVPAAAVVTSLVAPPPTVTMPSTLKLALRVASELVTLKVVSAPASSKSIA